MKDISDAEIIAKVCNGETDLFELLIERYKKQVFSIVGKRIPVQDVPAVSQAIFVSAWRSLPDYEGRKPFENWLSVIAMRGCCDYWRQRGAAKNQTVNAPDFIEMQDWLEKISTDSSVSCHEREKCRFNAAELVEWAMARLKPEDRLLIDMVYLQGASLSDAAEALKWSIAKTKVRAMRARHFMRKCIAGMEENEKKAN